MHPLGALTHQMGTVAGQRLVPIGSSEIAWFAPLLDPVDLTVMVVTADALHTTPRPRHLSDRQKRGLRVHRVCSPSRRTSNRLHARLAALPWPQADDHTTESIGHSRVEQRTLQTRPTPLHLDFPDTAQVFRITRDRTDRGTGTRETHTWFGVTSLT